MPDVPSEDTLPLLVFDGDCGFCTAAVDWAARRFRRPVEVAPWQRLELDELGLTREDVDLYAWWIERGDDAPDGLRRWRGHRAAGRALRSCRGIWPFFGLLLLLPPPVSWIWAAGYRLVARFRGYLPGATPACKLPPGERPTDRTS
jgi:predicted DCC family thiol-disulfide oxidoreductase YuxK